MRVGIGFDVHEFTIDRALVLGGVVVPYHLGLAGHSDADVLIHAMMDALLGAAGAGDIGRYFPDSEPIYKDSDSKVMLTQVMELVRARGLRVGNVDAVVIAQQPRLAAYFEAMRAVLAPILGVEQEAVNLKATTTEGLGFTGRQEGIAAQAVVLLYAIKDTWEEK